MPPVMKSLLWIFIALVRGPVAVSSTHEARPSSTDYDTEHRALRVTAATASPSTTTPRSPAPSPNRIPTQNSRLSSAGSPSDTPTHEPTSVLPFGSYKSMESFADTVRFAGVPIVILSLVLLKIHLDSLLSRSSHGVGDAVDRFGSITRFHLAHVAFSFTFCVSIFWMKKNNAGNLYDELVRPCTWRVLINPLYMEFELLTSCIFFGYYDAFFSSLQTCDWNQQRRKQRLRKWSYIAIGTLFMAGQVHRSFDGRPCRESSKYLLEFSYDLCNFVFFLDAAYVATLSKASASRGKGWRKLAVFLILTVSFGMGCAIIIAEVILGSLEAAGLPTLQVACVVVIPSVSFLVAMWQHDDIILDHAIRVDIESIISRSSTRFAMSIGAPLLPEFNLPSDTRMGQYQAAGLHPSEDDRFRRHHFSKDMTMTLGGDDDDDDDNDTVNVEGSIELGISALSEDITRNQIGFILEKILLSSEPLFSKFEIVASTGETHMTIEEVLRPPACMLNITRLFLAKISLPITQRCLQMHIASVENILSQAEPKKDDFGSTATKSQQQAFAERIKHHHRLVASCDEISSRYVAWIKLMSSVSELLPANVLEWSPNCMRCMKRSADKADLSTSFLSTNLQHHVSSIVLAGGTTSQISSMTFGAPAAHSLGFKGGGLRKLESLLASEVPSHPLEHVKALDIKFQVCAREAVVVSQALGGVISAAIDLLERAISNRDTAAISQYFEVGLLVHSICLLSTHGKEMAMLDDTFGAYERLDVSIKFKISSQTAGYANTTGSPHGPAAPPSFLNIIGIERNTSSPKCGSLTVVVGVAQLKVAAWLQSTVAKVDPSSMEVSWSHQKAIRVVPVLFNLGVNEKQTVANAVRRTELQSDINRRGIEKLAKYHEHFSIFANRQGWPTVPRGHIASTSMSGGQGSIARELPTLLARVRELVEDEASGRSRKNVDILLSSCLAARLLGGARTTSCKSAKDRTSMVHTLEVSRLAARAGVSGTVEACDALPLENEILSCLRGPGGVRLQNCAQNIGVEAYAFNQLQVRALPAELRPPLECVRSAVKS